MTLGTKAIVAGIVWALSALAVAAAGGSGWRWLVAGLAVAAGVGISLWQTWGVSRLLKRCLPALVRSTDEVTSAAGQLSTSSQSLAQGASEQAASLEQTSASSEELNSTTQRNAENGRTAAEVVHEVEREVVSANRTLAEMVRSMSEINDASDKIARIIKVIDEIAFQTNILALNAAVEAARAGEAGMGFAVVADEVRNLAQRSAQAAKDTAAMIEESIAKSADGTKKLDQVKEAISGITESATKMKTLVDEVSTGSQEQAQGFAVISESIVQMGEVTQKAAASAEQSASASEQLTAQARQMRKSLEPLLALIDGDTANDDEPIRPARVARPFVMPVTARPDEEEDDVMVFAASPEESFPLEDDFQ